MVLVKDKQVDSILKKQITFINKALADPNPRHSEKRGSEVLNYKIQTEEASNEEDSLHSVKSVDTFVSTPENENVVEQLTGLEAVRQAYLADNRNHFLKCMVHTLAEKKTKKLVQRNDKILNFQATFFIKRGIKPSID